MDNFSGDQGLLVGVAQQYSADPSRDIPVSDDAGAGKQDLFGPLEAALDLTPDMLHDHTDGLPEPSEGYSPDFVDGFDAESRVASKSYDRSQVLDKSWMQLEQKPVEFFWESGFWAEIFDDHSGSAESSVVKQFALHRPTVVDEPPVATQLDDNTEVSSMPSKRLRVATYMDVVSKSSVQSWREHRDSMWEVAIRRWHSSAMTWKGDDCFIQMLHSKPDFRGQCQIIVDILHHKAPGTLLKRCNSIGRLVNDLHAHQLNFPCSETELYDHLCRQRDAGAPPSRLKALMEAIVFVRHVFGCESLELAIKSRRCMGAASSKEATTIKQAPPLTVEHLRLVHSAIQSDSDPWNVAFCGMVLFCVYGRARWSDAQHSQFLEWDMDTDGNICFVECSTAVHKTCRALNMRHSFLPLPAPGVGITEDCWAACWRRARTDLDIEDLGCFPLMPAPDEGGVASVRPLSTAEAGRWLKVILMQYTSKATLQEQINYTSHSFKATCLSFLAKFGCSFEDRLALGYHTDQVRMALRYSRDGASRPLRVLEECLAAIRGGRFRPDETRSGRFIQVLDKEVGDVQNTGLPFTDDVKTENTDRIDSSEIAGETIDLLSDYATTCSESSSDEESVVMPKVPNRVLLIPDDMDVWKHSKLRTVHLAPKGNIRVLSCGRKITDRYKKEGIDHRFDVIKCTPCFKSLAAVRG